jgi:hypothetical protein
MDKGALEERLAAREEAAAVEEFRRRLQYNLGQVPPHGCTALHRVLG